MATFRKGGNRTRSAGWSRAFLPYSSKRFEKSTASALDFRRELQWRDRSPAVAQWQSIEIVFRRSFRRGDNDAATNERVTDLKAWVCFTRRTYRRIRITASRLDG